MIIGSIVLTVLGTREIIQRLQNLQRMVETESWIIPDQIAQMWRDIALQLGIRETGNYINAIGYREITTGVDFREFLIDTAKNPAVDYSWFVEYGTHEMEGRFPATKALDAFSMEAIWLMWTSLTLA